jgi:hypothetical protein
MSFAPSEGSRQIAASAGLAVFAQSKLAIWAEEAKGQATREEATSEAATQSVFTAADMSESLRGVKNSEKICPHRFCPHAAVAPQELILIELAA